MITEMRFEELQGAPISPKTLNFVRDNYIDYEV